MFRQRWCCQFASGTRYLRFQFHDAPAAAPRHAHRLLGEDALQVVKELSGLAGSQNPVSVLVVPHQGGSSVLDVGPVGRLGVVPHQWLSDLLPSEAICYFARLPWLVPAPPDTYKRPINVTVTPLLCSSLTSSPRGCSDDISSKKWATQDGRRSYRPAGDHKTNLRRETDLWTVLHEAITLIRKS